MIGFVALLQYWHGLEKNIECCDEHIPRMAHSLHTESCLHGNPYRLGGRDLEALLFCAAFECDVEGYH
jgi:hypothetical protein